MRKVVLNTSDDRPMWAMPEQVVPILRGHLPAGWTLETVNAPVSSRGDGGSVTAEAMAAARGAEVYIGAGVPREVFRAAQPTLRWAHSTTAGISSFLYDELVRSDVVFTNSAGVHAPPMAETVIGMILYFARGFDHAVRAQARGEWVQDPFIGPGSAIHEIAGSTLGIIGLGGIGREVRTRAEALGMLTQAFDSKSSRQDLVALLRASDYLLIAAPDTPQTRGLIGRVELALLKSGAVLLNVARGRVVDEAALIEALTSGKLRGAGLDVYVTEPLPADSPLWRLPNVLALPHVSAVTRNFWDRQLELLVDNLSRYLSGRPLRNVVDKVRGY